MGIRKHTPCSRVPALIRSIQRERISLFLLRRSLYECCRAFSTLSLAILMQFFALPLKPFANLNILSLFISVAPFQLKNTKNPLLLKSPDIYLRLSPLSLYPHKTTNYCQLVRVIRCLNSCSE